MDIFDKATGRLNTETFTEVARIVAERELTHTHTPEETRRLRLLAGPDCAERKRELRRVAKRFERAWQKERGASRVAE